MAGKKGLVNLRQLTVYIPQKYAKMGIVKEIERYSRSVNRSANAVMVRILAKATKDGKPGSLDKFLGGK